MRIVICGDVFPPAQSVLRQRLPAEAQDEIFICREHDQLSSAGYADVLIPMMFRIDGAAMDAIRPRLIHQWGSGLEGVDLEAARIRQIAVASAPSTGKNGDSVAEHMVLLMLSLLRQMPAAQASVRAGVLGAPLGRMLAGKTVCLYGLGATALALARRLRAFQVVLAGITRDPAAAKVKEFELDRCFSSQDRGRCLAETDILAVCTRLCAETKGIINADVFAALRPGAYLVNAARGALIDYRALYTALSNGRLAGAGLDVYWEEPISPADPLLALPNVIATPHVAGVTDGSYGDIADVVLGNIERLRCAQPILNRAV